MEQQPVYIIINVSYKDHAKEKILNWQEAHKYRTTDGIIMLREQRIKENQEKESSGFDKRLNESIITKIIQEIF